VVISTGKPPNTGYIRLNANPNDFTTPYMDIVERTGSGIYDVQLKTRLGDLSGVAGTRNVPGGFTGFGLMSETAFLSGSEIRLEAPRFLLGDLNQNFVSGSNSNLEISSSRFHLQPDGDTIMQGKITATSGKIGQFSIDSNDISGEGLKFLGTEGSQSIQIIDKDGSSTPAPGTIAMEILYTDTRGQRGNDVAAGPTILSDVDDIMLVTGDTGSFYVNPGMLRAWRQSGATAPSTYPLMGSGVVGITSELGDRNYQAPVFGVNSSTSTAGKQDWNAAGLFYQSFPTDIAGSGNFDRGAGIIAVGNGGDTNVSVLAHSLKTDSDAFSGVFHSGKFMVGDPFTRSDTNTLSTSNSDYTLIAYPADITGGTDNSF